MDAPKGRVFSCRCWKILLFAQDRKKISNKNVHLGSIIKSQYIDVSAKTNAAWNENNQITGNHDVLNLKGQNKFLTFSSVRLCSPNQRWLVKFMETSKAFVVPVTCGLEYFLTSHFHTEHNCPKTAATYSTVVREHEL